MAVTNTETFTNPRDMLPNAYAGEGGANAVTARAIDFVTRFGLNWEALRDILGIVRPIKKTPGTRLVSYAAKVELEDSVDPGCVVPYSKATVEEISHADLTLNKHAKAVPVEDVDKYGPVVAVQKTDDAFLNEIQSKIMGEFYTFLTDDTAAITSTETTWQMGVAVAIGLVKDKFKKMHKTATDVVVFVNTMDAYRYLGAAEITVQPDFGLEYVSNFTGARPMILSSEIEEGTIIAVPVENIVMYYADPGDYSVLGLNFVTDGETNLIGFHANGNYNTFVGESEAIYGIKLWAEYADGIAIVTVDDE